MSATFGSQLVCKALALAGVAMLLSGCTYDYLQRTDRVAYHAGNAVQANTAIQTTNPTKASMYNTSGLGKNGNVMPPPAATP
jgi:protein involved in sex pheromone biosynthesis